MTISEVREMFPKVDMLSAQIGASSEQEESLFCEVFPGWENFEAELLVALMKEIVWDVVWKRLLPKLLEGEYGLDLLFENVHIFEQGQAFGFWPMVGRELVNVGASEEHFNMIFGALADPQGHRVCHPGYAARCIVTTDGFPTELGMKIAEQWVKPIFPELYEEYLSAQ